MTYDARTTGDSTGTKSFVRLLGIEGDDQATSVLTLIPVPSTSASPGSVETRVVSASTDLFGPTNGGVDGSDAGKILDCISSSATVITLRLDSVTGLNQSGGNPIFAARQRGTGAVTWAAEAGVTINNPQGLTFVQNGQALLFTEVSANVWNLG